MKLHYHILYDGEPRYTAYSNVYTALVMARGRTIRSCTCGTYNIDHTPCTPERYVEISNTPLDDIDTLIPVYPRGHQPEWVSNRKIPTESQMKRWHRREVRMGRSGKAVARISMKSGKAYLG